MSWPTPEATKLINAMVSAEGGPDAFVRAVRISIPNCTDYEDARGIAANTIAHALMDFIDNHDQLREFVTMLGSRWAPVGTQNDPNGLNQNWVPNVISSLRSQGVIV